MAGAHWNRFRAVPVFGFGLEISDLESGLTGNLVPPDTDEIQQYARDAWSNTGVKECPDITSAYILLDGGPRGNRHTIAPTGDGKPPKTVIGKTHNLTITEIEKVIKRARIYKVIFMRTYRQEIFRLLLGRTMVVRQNLGLTPKSKARLNQAYAFKARSIIYVRRKGVNKAATAVYTYFYRELKRLRALLPQAPGQVGPLALEDAPLANPHGDGDDDTDDDVPEHIVNGMLCIEDVPATPASPPAVVEDVLATPASAPSVVEDVPGGSSSATTLIWGSGR